MLTAGNCLIFRKCKDLRNMMEDMDRYQGERIHKDWFDMCERIINEKGVVVDNFQMLESKSVTDGRRAQAGGSSGGQQGNYSNTNTSNNDNPFANVAFGSGDPFQSNDDVTDISDDELPF